MTTAAPCLQHRQALVECARTARRTQAEVRRQAAVGTRATRPPRRLATDHRQVHPGRSHSSHDRERDHSPVTRMVREVDVCCGPYLGDVLRWIGALGRRTIQGRSHEGVLDRVRYRARHQRGYRDRASRPCETSQARVEQTSGVSGQSVRGRMVFASIRKPLVHDHGGDDHDASGDLQRDVSTVKERLLHCSPQIACGLRITGLCQTSTHA